MIPEFHYVSAPPHNFKPEQLNEDEALKEDWQLTMESARTIYTLPRTKQSNKLGRVALGSVKSNPVVEVMFADIFSTRPFHPQDLTADPLQRSCPIFLRYRNTDTAPPSCCSGLTLSKQLETREPGIYWENEEGQWKCAPWRPAVDAEDQSDPKEKSLDAAIVLYVERTDPGTVDVALGGFSTHATRLLGANLPGIVSQLPAPAYSCGGVSVGLCVIAFSYHAHALKEESRRGGRLAKSDAEWTIHVVSESVLERHFAS